MNLQGITKINNIVSVEVLKNFFLKVTFDDGEQKTIDMKPFIGGGISEELKDPAYFEKVYIDNGAITWPNGYDFCPVYLKNELTNDKI